MNTKIPSRLPDVLLFGLERLDADNTVPLYQQLHDVLRDELLDRWPPDRAIPSERQLMQLTGLSRMTVRQAITDLVHEGMLRRDHGRGTFIADSRVTRSLTGHASFREAVAQEGRNLETTVVRQKLSRASPAQATLLRIEAGESVCNLVRLRSIDGLPAMLDYTVVPLRLCPDVLFANLRNSLYDYLTDHGIPPKNSVDVIEAVAAEGEVAQLLDVPDAAPLLLMRRLARTIDDVPFELTDEFVRPDRCSYRVEVPSGTSGIDLAGRPPS